VRKLAAVSGIGANKLGKKNYELTNHLGNVNAVITDRKVVNPSYAVSTFTNSTDGWTNCSNASLATSATQLDVTITGTNNCIYKLFTTVSGQNYTVCVKSSKGSTSGIKVKAFGSSLISTVNLADNEFTTFIFQANSTTTSLTIETVSSTSSGNYSVDEVSITPNSIYEAVVIMKSDYYPFGMQMPGRTLTTSNYRFGYNGMEKDPELKGDGNSYTTEFRQYDPRLGRWMSLDPAKLLLPQQSPYCAMDNNPILFTDIDGDIVKALNTRSATQLKSTLTVTFSGTPVVNLFQFEADGLTLKEPNAVDLANALVGLDQVTQDLAYAYYKAITDQETHTVEFVYKNENIASPITFTDANGVEKTSRTGQDVIDHWGGGVTGSARGWGSIATIVIDHGAGNSSSQDENLAETLAHEMLGHGYGGNNGTGTSVSVDPIQTGNLVRQRFKYTTLRDGSDHEGGAIPNNLIKLTPVHFKGVDGFISKNTSVQKIQWIAKGTKYQIKFDSMKAEKSNGKYLTVTDMLTGNKHEVFRDKSGGYHFKEGPEDK